MTAWVIARGDLADPRLLALIELHLRAAAENSPAGSVFALNLSGLRDPALRLWTLCEGPTLLGMGALKALDAATAEVKSMRTAPGQQRRGVARAVLAHLVAEAKTSGHTALKLETGANDAFAPARALYEGFGFVPSAPFGDDVLTDFNRCYALDLQGHASHDQSR